MRSFSGLYFFLRTAVYLITLFSHVIRSHIYINQLFAVGTVFFLTSLTIAIAKPYHKANMNYWDIAILSHLAILCYALSSGVSGVRALLHCKK